MASPTEQESDPSDSGASDRRQLWFGLGGLILVAAVAVALVVVSRRSHREPATALAATRALEVRFSAAPFAAHRPYQARPGAAAVEPIAGADLARLERAGDRAALLAAAAMAGDRVRALAIARVLPVDGASRADRAALALIDRDPAAALEALGPAAGDTPSGAWNRALALRDLDLPFAAEAAFTAIGVGGEPGWADEAGARADALVAEVARRGPDLADRRALELRAAAARDDDRVELAAALLDEVIRRGDGAGCAGPHHARVGLAELALIAGDRDRARAALPAPEACPAATDAAGAIVAVDLARQSGRDDDRARAAAWLARPDPRAATARAIGAARLAVERDPAAGEAALAAAIAGARADDDPAIVAWAWAARQSSRAAAGDWSGVVDVSAAELRRPPPDRCAVVVSADDDRLTIAVRGADGRTTGSLRRVPRLELATAPLLDDADRARLAGCDAIPVFARPPFHGRADVVPPGLPWSFAGAAPAAPRTAAPPRTVIVSDPVSAPGRDLPPVVSPRPIPGAIALTGAGATPAGVLAALRDATYVELHVHAAVDLGDASYLALSPDAGGASSLTAAELRRAELRGAPIVVLAAARALHPHARWSLPDALLAAGARAVVAADVPLPAIDSVALFDRLRGELERGATPAAALATARAAFAAAPWSSHVMLFE